MKTATKFVVLVFVLAAFAAVPQACLAAGSDPFTVPSSVASQGVFSCGDMTVSGGGTIDSAGIGSSGPTNHGTIRSNGKITISSSTVNGDAIPGPGKIVSVSGSGSVSGSTTPATSAFGCTPITLSTLATSLASSNDDATIPVTGQGKSVLAGSSHTEFSMSGGDTLTLPGGTYYFTKFTISGGSTITLGGPVRILVTGNVNISGGSFVNSAAYSFRFWHSGTTFSLSSSTFTGIVYAPSASLTISSSRFIGTVFANAVTVSGGTSHVTRSIDDVVPSVAITSPANGSAVADPTHVLVQGTASDAQTEVTVTVNGQTVPIAADGTWQTTLNLSGGPSPATITAVATDAIGNSKTATITVTVVPPPTLTLTAPVPSSFVNARIVNIFGGAGAATSVTVNGQAAVVSGGAFSITGFDLGPDGPHTLTIIGTNLGGSATITPVVTNDTVFPTIHASVSPLPNAAGWNNTDVTVTFTCSDVGTGVGTCPAAVVLSTEGAGVSVTRTTADLAGNTTPATVTVNIDKTAPAITITAPTANQIVSDPHVTVTGYADDSINVTVNGTAAVIDATSAIYTAQIALAEGDNTIRASGTDRAGNNRATTVTMNLDTRAPELSIATPAANACLKNAQIAVTGRALDPHITGVNLSIAPSAAAPVSATVAADGTWSANVTAPAEGRYTIIVEGSDSAGHVSKTTLPVTIDSTAPVVQVTESGAAFTGGITNHSLAISVRATDSDAAAAITTTLNGQPYVSGTTITTNGDYTLATSARDCAGNVSNVRTITFTIDTVAPSIVSFTPVDATNVGVAQQTITGLLDADDVVSVTISGTNLAATISGRTFTFTSVPLAEGPNHFTMTATDRAGNSSSKSYALNSKSTTPMVDILESGNLIAAGTLFNRAVSPVVRVSEGASTVTATLNSNPFVSGTAITADGSYTLRATATDSFGHTSPEAIATFSVDTTPPIVRITAPANSAVIHADHADVHGTVSGSDIARLTVGGIATTPAGDGSFSTTVPLESGPNVIAATAVDRAGNSGSDVVTVTRDANRAGIILTLPADNVVTNRATTPVIGQVITPSLAASVTLNGVAITLDSTGVFRKDAVALVEGNNTITAAVTDKGGTVNSVTVHVPADFTPPHFRVLANGDELTAGARFPTPPLLTLDASDSGGVSAASLTVDGVAVAVPFTPAANGGHVLVATARDLAGNETRVDRTFSIGDVTASSGGCPPASFDPADGSSIASDHVLLTGRAAASNVLVGSAVVPVVDGVFAVSTGLTNEGANAISVTCADASGHALGNASTLTLFRFTNAPSVTITSPLTDSELTAEKTPVVITAGPGVTSGDINGIAFTVTGDTSISHTLTINDVPIANGLNVIMARVRNTAGRSGFASVHVRRYGGSPQISITSPLPATQTGATSISVSGGFANVDPATLAVTAGGVSYLVTPRNLSDTTGTFAASVPLAAAQTTTVTASARNRATGAVVSESIDIQQVPGAPSIVITSPADNTYFRSDAPKPAVIGTFTAALAATVQVNGNVVQPAGASFSTTIDFAPGSTGLTPVVSRVANVDGTSATAAVRVIRLAAPLSVSDSYPSQNATEVDPGVMLLVLFNNPIDKSSIANGTLRLTDAAGAEITGTYFIDHDALSFAPRVPLALATAYTFTVSQTLKDVAGGAAASPFVLSFTTASTAPSSGPSITPLDASGCLTSHTIHGTASAPGARVQLAMDGLTQPTTAASDRSFSYTVDVSAPGVHVARVRELGADGTLSPETAVTIRVTCSSLQVVGATIDKVAKSVTIQFSKPVKLTSLTAAPGGTIQITPSGASAISGTVALNAAGDTATVTTTVDLSAPVVTLLVKKDVQDLAGGTLAGDYTQTFSATGDAPIEPGNGYVSGGAFDASTGRALPNATVTIQAPTSAFRAPSPRLVATSVARLQPVVEGTGTTATNSFGRYARTLPEGAYTIEVDAPGYTTAWRQVIVRAGAGVLPVDIRLTRRAAGQLIGAGAVTITSAADTTITHAAELTIPAASALASHTVTLTAVGAQSLSGLLPLGWSPLAAVEVAIDGSAVPAPMAGAQLAFVLNADDLAAVTASNQTLSLAEYDSDRDEWRAVVAVAPSPANSRLTFPLTRSGNYALVYPDRGIGLAQPAAATGGSALQGVVSACTGTCAMVSRGFTLDPTTILPNGSTTATLRTDPAPKYPSGTAVQAYIDEQLNLADGRVILDPPFATDLLIYRSLTNDAGVAVFHLAPTSTAAAETLRDGVDHIRIVDYPGRLDRGTLIGAEGGRVPGDGSIVIDIPAGATTQSLHATVTPFGPNDVAAVGAIPGFHVAGGFTLALLDTNGAGVATLLKQPRATFNIDAAKFASANRQAIVAEVLTNTPYGAMLRLAAVTQSIATDAPGANLFTTRSLSTAELPLDGIVRAGRYVILTADAPIAYAWGQVHAGNATAPALPNARVTAGTGKPMSAALGVTDLTRPGGVFVVPVAATPAAQFSLIARTDATGDGDVTLGAAVPAAGAFVPFGVLPLTAPPLASPVINPADGSTITVDAAFGPQAVFATNIDSTSVTNGITITNLTSGHTLAGTTTAAGAVVSFHTNEKLEAGSSYVLTVAATIRSASGRLFGRNAVSHFSTYMIPPSNTTIHPEKIRITIPDANGISTVIGAAGALPTGDQALAVRRGLAFINSPQATVTGDGSFQFTAGDGVSDIISTTDVIDLQVIDSVSHSIVAIVPLTPFVTADGTGFLAPVGVTTTFTAAAPLGVTVTVPAGAFAVPTLVRLTATAPSDFANVPNLASELHLNGGVRIDFDGIAQKPLELTIPAPAGTSITPQYFLGMLGQSTRGPRIEIVDTLRLVGGNFTTTLDPSSATVRISSIGTHAQSTFPTPADVKAILARVTRPAAYTPIDMSIGVGWAEVTGASDAAEIFWDSISSLFISSYTLSRNLGRALIPVAANRPFTVVGVDASTGLQAFTKVYSGFASGDPAGAVVLDPVDDNDTGPMPTFASPARIESVEVPPVGVTLTSVRNLSITYSNGRATIAWVPPTPAPKTLVEVFNPSRGVSPAAVDISSAPIPPIVAQPGDRLFITITEHDVDPDSSVTISFNKRMNVGGATDEASITQFLKTLIIVKTDDEDQPSLQAAEVTEQVKFNADSDAHRITLTFGGALQLGKRYSITLKKNMTDASGMLLGQSRVGGQLTSGLNSDLKLQFTVRKPGGLLATNTLIAGSVIHDMSLNGNLALVAAGDGGIQAFDISDPANLANQPPLSAFINCDWNPATNTFTPCGFGYWAVASDHHGRIITTGMSGQLGALKTFRIRDFIQPTQLDVADLPRVALDKQVGGTPISWTPGINSLMPIGSEILLSDKPEAIPRRVQILLQDDDVKLSRAALITKYRGGTPIDLGNGYQKLTLQITPDQPAYQSQTITIENRTLKLRWSVDVPRNQSKSLAGIVAGPNDDLHVYVNRTTYAVVSLFGFGVGVYDVNAIESNDHPIDPDYKPLAEIVALTNGNSDEATDPLTVRQCNQADLATSGLPCAIEDLTYTPEALMRTGGGEVASSSQLLALEQHRGIFDGVVTPPTATDDKILPGSIKPNSAGLSLTSPYLAQGGGWDSLDQPRLRTLRDMYQKISGVGNKDIRPVGRHTGIAYYARPPAADSRTAVSDEYALIASFQYGVIVVKLNGQLSPDSVVDVIWIPAGAMSVRVMPRGDMAVVVDGAGRVLLVDLRRIDESSKVNQPVKVCQSADCTDVLFPSAAASLKKKAQLPPDADWTEAGVDDPRIIWKSAPHLVHGTLAPLVDPDTGIVFTGDVNGTAQAEINAIAATDPRVRFMVNTGDPTGYRETGALVPLGIAPPSTVTLTGPDASLAAFRLELWLPGSIANSLTNSNQELRMALESERILGVATEQTVEPFAPAHLRRTTIEGGADPRVANFKLSRLVPYNSTDPDMKSIRYQEGYNHFASPWVVTMTDPRAAKDYIWNALAATKTQLECASCDRPQFLKNGVPGTDYFELLSLGNFIAARPESNLFAGTKYSYLGTANRMKGLVSTIPADLVRPSDGATPLDNVVARNLPTEGTTTEGVVALNTGEVVTGATDLAIKGRGIDFVLTRYYSSAIAHIGPFGRNFDSPLFARVRALPNGDVEFYDGTGRRDLFTGGKTPPVGVFLRMTGSTDKIVVSYPDNTRLYFDALGRLSKMTDRNLTKTDGSDGNTMSFFYGVNGKLAAINDPTNRAIRFDYYTSTGGDAFEGCISKVTDFDNRVVNYSYDTSGRLTNVSGPDPESLNSAMPSTTYHWGSSASSGTKQQIYASGQLAKEIDGLNRTVWTAGYFPSSPWAAQTLISGGGTWTFTPTDNSTTVLDPNNHSWEYGRDPGRRIHYLKEPGDATTTNDYDDDGRLTSVTRPLGDRTTYAYAPPAAGDRRSMLNVETATEYPRTGSDEAAANQTRVTRIGYGTANLPTSITTPDGATTLIKRDERGNPQSTTDAVGITTTTLYDERGLLRTSSDPRTGDATYDYYTGSQAGYLHTIETSAGTLTYESDSRGNTTEVIDPSNKSARYGVNKLDQVESESKGDAQTTMIYDATGELTSKQILSGVDDNGQPIFRSMTFGVDEVGRLHTRIDGDQATTIGYDPKGNIKTFTRTGKPPATFGYDARDRFITETVGTQNTTYGYDDDRALSTLTNARDQSTAFVKSGFGESLGDTNPLGVTTTQTTDAAGRPVDTKVIKKTADGKTFVLRWSKQEYDSLGRVTRQIQKLFNSPLELPAGGSDPIGATDVISRMIYDDANRKTTAIDPRGNATVSEMDELGRLHRVTDALGDTMEYEYDANGNKYSETMTEVAPDGRREASKVTYLYDDQNRVVERIDVTNAAIPLTTRYGYDKQGNMSSQTDPDGNTTTMQYDLRRRMTKKTDAMGGVTTYGYDEADRLLSVTDANRNQTSFTYDTNGNLVAETRADGATWSYTYDENFNRKTVTDPNGTVVTFVYDGADRLIEKQIAKGTNVLGPSDIRMTLDDLDRTIATSTDEGILETFAYDSIGRQLSESLQIGTGPKRTFTRTFDPSGNLVGLDYPSGLKLTYDIDKLDRIAAIHDAASPTIPIVAYTDIGGRPATKTFANGVTETWSYDPNHRLAEILNKVQGATLRDVQYQRSRSGDKLSAIRPDLGTKSEFTYNSNHWMTKESTGIPLTGLNPQPALAVGYDIDPVLNMRAITRTTSAPSGTASSPTNFTINNRNQYTAASNEPLTYDRNGNLTSRSGLSMQYDYEDRLRKATVASRDVVENIYDASGRKVQEKFTTGSTIHTNDYALSRDQVREEYLDFTLYQRYVHGRAVDEMVRGETNGTTVYPHRSEVGNVDRLTDGGGQTLERYEYEGYGHVSIFSPSNAPLTASMFGWKWLFQSREYQPLLGTFDFRARTLWPDLARFGQEDSARARRLLSSYEAFGGAPQDTVDPSGLYEEDVHHYLTRFLASSVGFGGSKDSVGGIADRIGYETGALDYDERDAMYDAPQIWKGSLANEENDLDFHFVDYAQLVGTLEQRAVMENSFGNQDDFRSVGEYLHALEDSYSHQKNRNERSFENRYGPNLGHSYKGKGPDWTWSAPPIAMAMARETYAKLKGLCHEQPVAVTCKENASWASIASRVTNFVMEAPGPADTFLWEIHYDPAVSIHTPGVTAKFLDKKVGYLNSGYHLNGREQAIRNIQKVWSEGNSLGHGYAVHDLYVPPWF